MHLVFFFFFYINSNLVNVLFHDNALPHVARMTLQKLTDFGYETLSHSPYSLNLFPIDDHF